MLNKSYSLLLFLWGIIHLTAVAQFQPRYQYFDGADSSTNAIQVVIGNEPHNIWQVGKPHKVIFDSAATLPNAILTDTIHPYPINNTSSFSFHEDVSSNIHSILAVRWKQKLDMDKHTEGAIIEFSTDKGVTWQNAFNNSLVHNFYGYNQANKDTLNSGEYALSGTDSTWKDVWFCILNLGNALTSLDYRFTFKSDNIQTNKEGWMIDDLMFSPSIMHIVKENEKSKYLNVYPTATQGTVNIEAKDIAPNHVIQKIELFASDGRLMKSFVTEGTKPTINISQFPNGMYYLKIDTNLQKEVFPLILAK